jgi:hypothetical protein
MVVNLSEVTHEPSSSLSDAGFCFAIGRNYTAMLDLISIQQTPISSSSVACSARKQNNFFLYR